LADDRGRPVAFALTPGNVADITMAAPLLGAVARPKRLLADKAYDADSLRKWLKQRKIKAPGNMKGRQADGGRGASGERLQNEVFAWKLRQIVAHQLRACPRGDDEDVIRRGQFTGQSETVLEERLATDQLTKRLGPFGDAQGPKPTAMASGGADDGQMPIARPSLVL
jgi:transposase